MWPKWQKGSTFKKVQRYMTKSKSGVYHTEEQKDTVKIMQGRRHNAMHLILQRYWSHSACPYKHQRVKFNTTVKWFCFCDGFAVLFCRCICICISLLYKGADVSWMSHEFPLKSNWNWNRYMYLVGSDRPERKCINCILVVILFCPYVNVAMISVAIQSN